MSTIAPAGLSPNETTTRHNASFPVDVSFLYSDPEAQASLSYEIQHRPQSGSFISTGIIPLVVSNNTLITHTFPAGTFLPNITYEWQARTTDSASFISAWSSIAVFATNAVPTATPQSPISGAKTNTRNQIPLAFGYSDVNGHGQGAFEISMRALSLAMPTLARASTAHLPDGRAVASGVPRYNLELVRPGATNLVRNGNFARGTTDWAGENGTVAATSNTLSSTGNGTASFARARQSLLVQDNSRTYFIRCRARVTSSVCTSIAFFLRDGTGGATYNYAAAVSSPVLNQWYTIIFNITVGTMANPLHLYAEHMYADAATANGKVMELQEVLAVDLTADGLTSRTAAEITALYPAWFNTRLSPGHATRKGLLLEEGTTNILTANQASVETNLTGFSANAVGTTLTRDVAQLWQGQASLRAACNGVRTSQGFNTAQAKTTVSPNLPYSASVLLRGAGNAELCLHENATTDGTVWTTRTSALDNDWNSVCWSAERGLFVAVASSGLGNRVMTSADGITWTSRTSAADNEWLSVCWSAERGLFVAVASTGTGNRVMTSPASTRTSVGVALTDTWTQYAVSQELGAAAESVHLTVGTSVAQNTTFWTDGLQVEQKPFATSWHLPGTTRAEEIISAPLANIVFPTQGEVGFWWNPRTPVSAIISQAASPILLQIGTHHSNASLTLWAWHNAGAEPHLMLYVRGQSAGGWSLVQIVRASGSGWYQQDLFNNYAVTWSGGHNFRVYRNGTLVGGPYTIADPVTAWHGTQIWFGNDGAGQGTPGALIDDIRISRTERTGAEILAGFNSGAPLPVDSDTTYKANFDGNLGVN